MISAALSLHVLSAIIWVGGMFFAYVILRPIAATQLAPPERLTLWSAVFSKFFPWVWAAIILLLLTGFAIIGMQYGGMKNVGMHVHLMLTLGIIMILLFMHINFAPARRLAKAVAESRWEDAASSLGQIRMLIGINLIIGLAVSAIATGGRYLLA